MATNTETPAPSGAAAQPTKRPTLTFELYQIAFNWYRDMGDRTPRGLQKKFGFSPKMASQLIHIGVPEHGWASFREHAHIHDEARMASDLMEQQSKYTELQDAWGKARADNLKLARASKGALAVGLQKTMEAVQNMKFVTFKKVRGPQGTWETIEIPFNARQTCDVLRMIAQSMRDIGQFESFWMGGKPLSDQSSPLKGWGTLTAAQIDYVASTGQLPPGVSDEQLFGVALPVVAEKRAKN